MAYRSMLQRSADGPPISCYTLCLCPRPPLPFTLLPYPSTLHYSPHPFRTPRSYTQSSTSPSALFRTLATPLLRMPRKCRYLHTAVKSKKRGLSPVASFLCLRTRTAGLVILRTGSLRPASLPGPVTPSLSQVVEPEGYPGPQIAWNGDIGRGRHWGSDICCCCCCNRS